MKSTSLSRARTLTPPAFSFLCYMLPLVYQESKNVFIKMDFKIQ